MLTLVGLVLSVFTPPQERTVEHWTFDGDPAPGKANGRVQFVDSPIGASGQMLVLNGVDAFVQVDPAGTIGAGKGDFTVSLWICPIELRDAVILSRGDAAMGWAIRLSKDGSIRAQFSTGEALQTEPRRVGLNEWVHLGVTRGTLHVNARPAAKGAVRDGDLDPPKAPLRFGRGPEDGKFFCGLIDDVRLYAKALDPGEIARIAGEGLPWVPAKAHAGTPFAGAFSLEQDDVLALAGGEDVLAAQESGHLEAILSSSAVGKRVLFRSLSWEGDTVYEQPRPLNFGSWRDQLSRVGASVIFAQYGQVEALEGKAGLERFTAAYDRLLGEFSTATRRIVVVSPFPYEKPPSPRPDLSGRNGDLRLYVESIRAIASKRNLLFVDLFEARFDGPITRDGLHLSAAGHEAVAREIARRLGVVPKGDVEPLRPAIRKKNRLWLDYWRPLNWAFLNGDRIEQPSSRDHADKRVRWFPVEVQQTLALLRREEAAIERLLGERR